MGRARFVVFAVVMLLGALAVGGQGVVAQNATPAATEDHPLVGVWLFDTDLADPANPFSLDTFTSEGTYFEVDAEGGTSVGVWEPTGANTANLTFWGLDPDGGRLVVRADIEVAEDGQSLTATYNLEFITPDGTSTGQIGPGMAEGTKLQVEALGEPVGTFEEMFGEEPGGTPEATPAG